MFGAQVVADAHQCIGDLANLPRRWLSQWHGFPGNQTGEIVAGERRLARELVPEPRAVRLERQRRQVDVAGGAPEPRPVLLLERFCGPARVDDRGDKKPAPPRDPRRVLPDLLLDLRRTTRQVLASGEKGNDGQDDRVQ